MIMKIDNDKEIAFTLQVATGYVIELAFIDFDIQPARYSYWSGWYCRDYIQVLISNNLAIDTSYPSRLLM